MTITTTQSAQMNFHAARISNVFSPNRGIPRNELNSFFHFFDHLIRFQRAGRDLVSTQFASNNVYKLLGALASWNRPLASSVARMNGPTRPAEENQHMRGYINADVDQVVRKLLSIFSESEVQMVFDSLVQTIMMSTSETDPRKILYKRLDPGIVEYIKKNRECGVAGFEIPD
ncbi:MAG: hypothetical protein HY094_04345 [Candidatus Melainabacteria bacterium]|nr:hypothetical protein [Candidatus Melainabacteria bacterium]